MLATLALVLSVQTPQEIVLRDALVVARVGRAGRSAIQTDAVAWQMAEGTFRAPRVGDSVSLPGLESRSWKALSTAEDGWLADSSLQGGYAYYSVEVPRAGVMILDAAGHSMVYVNGAPRGGDVYGFGYVRLPVALRAGKNELLFAVSRGRMRAKLSPAVPDDLVQAGDPTLPDFVLGESGRAMGAVVVANPHPDRARITLVAEVDGVRTETSVLVEGSSVIKAPIEVPRPKLAEAGKAVLRVTARHPSLGEGRREFEVFARGPGEVVKRTYRSAIDGSVQYYAVQPAEPGPGQRADALILSVHGAGVEATGQAAAYGRKSWANLIAATNRRPYGFDWEDWGRMDALEALRHATRMCNPAPDKVYLTGHSMGGHGTWYLGATHPHLWGAIGPAAGWIDFWSYGGAIAPREGVAIDQMLRRAANVSDTKLLINNYKRLGVFALHGDADETVSVEQPRQMRKLLEDAGHRDVDWFEQPGGGHWYDTTDAPGADCVDFPPMMEFFQRRRVAGKNESLRVDFTTVSPGVSAESAWVKVWRQEKQLEPSRVRVELTPALRRVTGDTSNVTALKLDLNALEPGRPVTFALDGGAPQERPWPADGQLFLSKGSEGWKEIEAPSPHEKGPHRYANFKTAFDREFVLVFGTAGPTADWSKNRARFDAENWWYRGNGRAEVMSDVEFLKASTVGRSVILYGNADSNKAWTAALGNCPLVVRAGELLLNEKKVKGDDIGGVFLYPRAGEYMALVGAVTGTGIKGMRATDRMPYFLAGVHYPDVFLFRSSFWRDGSDAFVLSGWFGPSWSSDGADLLRANP